MKKKMDMARIGPSSGTRPERVVLAALRKWIGKASVVANDRSLPGSPDAHVAWLRAAIFVDGRFWHDPAYAKARSRPHHRTDFAAKARRNRRRDLRDNGELRKRGYLVVRIWCSSVTGKARTERTLDRLFDVIAKRAPFIGSKELGRTPSRAIRL